MLSLLSENERIRVRGAFGLEICCLGVCCVNEIAFEVEARCSVCRCRNCKGFGSSGDGVVSVSVD